MLSLRRVFLCMVCWWMFMVRGLIFATSTCGVRFVSFNFSIRDSTLTLDISLPYLSTNYSSALVNEVYPRVVSEKTPCIIFCRNLRPDETFMEIAVKNNVPLLMTDMPTNRITRLIFVVSITLDTPNNVFTSIIPIPRSSIKCRVISGAERFHSDNT